MFEPEDPNLNNGGGASSNTGASLTGVGIIVLDAASGTEDFNTLIQIINDKSCQYRGRIIYIKRLSPDYNWPDPFLFENKFYFNEDCEWYESPFALGSVLG